LWPKDVQDEFDDAQRRGAGNLRLAEWIVHLVLGVTLLVTIARIVYASRWWATVGHCLGLSA